MNYLIVNRVPMLIPVLCVALMLTSCVSTKRGALQKTLDQQKQYVSSGEHQKAIDGYNNALKYYPEEAVVVRSYIHTLERMKTSADQAYKEKKYSSAIQNYAVLSKNYHHFESFEKSLSFDLKYLNLMLKKSRLAWSEMQAQRAVNAGDFVTAIKAYQASIMDYSGDQSLTDSLTRIVQDIHRRMEETSRNEDLVSAGKAYSLLLSKYSFLEKYDQKLSKETFEAGLKRSRTVLTRKGLKQYREGNLEEAISIWKDILKFDPDNIEINKAIESAESQLKKTKKDSSIEGFVINGVDPSL